MGTASCDFCGSVNASQVHLLHDELLGLPGDFPLVRCESCGLLYLWPRPTDEDLRDRYPDSYPPFRGKQRPVMGWRRWIRNYGLARRCRAITSRKRGGRLLDIGCAGGEFLDEMRRHGHWEVEGLEPSANAASAARERFGLRVFQGTLVDAAYPDAHFDAVTLWSVLEHLPSPHRSLQEVHRILKPNGLLLVQVPDPLSWQARLFGAAWAGFDAPRHLFAFPRDVLLGELSAQGFRSVSAQPLAGGYASFMTSICFWLGAKRHQRLAQLAGHIGTSAICQAAGAPFFLALRMLRLASSLTYLAAKPAAPGPAGGQ
jgi:SAM-dependent methyltransferase